MGAAALARYPLGSEQSLVPAVLGGAFKPNFGGGGKVRASASAAS